jgi:outer membrane protein assembly factor BamE
MITRLIFSLTLATLIASGCGLIYTQNIQQGNALEQDDLDELYVGMNQRQVLFVLGTPSVKDPFHPERWDYVQTFSRRGSPMVQRTITLRFEDDLLSEIDGHTDPFGAIAKNVTGDANEVASFVKSPDESSENDAGDGDGGDTEDSPQDAAIESAEEEVLEGVDPDIEAIEERTSEDREYQRDMDVLDQTPDGDRLGPDIDG